MQKFKEVEAIQNGFIPIKDAWDRLPKTADESGYVCKEMLHAIDVIQMAIANDMIDDAKECFAALYEKHANKAIQNKEHCEWFHSIGSNTELRDQYLDMMILCNKIDSEQAKTLGYYIPSACLYVAIR